MPHWYLIYCHVHTVPRYVVEYEETFIAATTVANLQPNVAFPIVERGKGGVHAARSGVSAAQSLP